MSNPTKNDSTYNAIRKNYGLIERKHITINKII